LVLGLIASVVVGVVFLVAGAAKVVQGPVWTQQAAAMRVSPRVARVVPWWEVVVGSMLIAGLLSPGPALAAYVTLVVFTIRIVGLLRAGQAPPCACFGAWRIRPISWVDVARNAGLMALSAVALLR
jgi:hypothetical protein